MQEKTDIFENLKQLYTDVKFTHFSCPHCGATITVEKLHFQSKTKSKYLYCNAYVCPRCSYKWFFRVEGKKLGEGSTKVFTIKMLPCTDERDIKLTKVKRRLNEKNERSLNGNKKSDTSNN